MSDKNSNTFDIKKFNQDFEDYLDRQKKSRLEREAQYLESKTVVKREKLLHELSFYELVVNTKNTVFNIMDEIVNNKVTKETFIKDNRLFYIGLLLIIFAMILIALNIVMPKQKKKFRNQPQVGLLTLKTTDIKN